MTLSIYGHSVSVGWRVPRKALHNLPLISLEMPAAFPSLARIRTCSRNVVYREIKFGSYTGDYGDPLSEFYIEGQGALCKWIPSGVPRQGLFAARNNNDTSEIRFVSYTPHITNVQVKKRNVSLLAMFTTLQ